MKKIIYTLLFTLVQFSFSQETIVPIENMPNTNTLENSNIYYFKDVNNVLDKFLGTWKYESATESLEITFNKIEHKFSNKNYKDNIVAHYNYKQNGVTIIDTTTLDFEEEWYLIFGSLVKNNNNTLDLIYSEPNDERYWSADLILDYNAPSSTVAMPTLNWHIETLSRKIVNGQKVYPYQVPENLVLVKQP